MIDMRRLVGCHNPSLLNLPLVVHPPMNPGEMESRGFLFCPSSKSVKNLINRLKTLDFYQLVIYN